MVTRFCQLSLYTFQLTVCENGIVRPDMSSTFTLSIWLKTHYGTVWWACFITSTLPSLYLIYAYHMEKLGPNPYDHLISSTGIWALILLIITLAITPLRRILTLTCQRLHSRFGKRLSDWNWIIRLRRMFGLMCFWYASLHVAVYLHFDVDWNWQWVQQDLSEKDYILLGLAAFALLIPLAATTTKGMMRRLGKYWRKLHRLIYLIAILSVLHQYLQSKAGDYNYLVYMTWIGILFAYRLLAHYGWLLSTIRDDGMEVPERQ